jgi:ParB-like chromosome segregation protein Spo0J
MTQIRTQELIHVSAAELRANPLNWRTHPGPQTDALKAIQAKIGFVGAVVARRLEDGTLELIDGHLRKDIAGDEKIPVLVVDLSEEEAALALATYDTVTVLAGQDEIALKALLAEVADMADSEALKALMGVGQGGGVAAPEDFPEVGEDIPTDYCCPKCGYEWSGKQA